MERFTTAKRTHARLIRVPLLQVVARGRVKLLAVPRLHLLGAALCGAWVCSERVYARCGHGARGGRAGGLLCMPEATAGYYGHTAMASRPSRRATSRCTAFNGL